MHGRAEVAGQGDVDPLAAAGQVRTNPAHMSERTSPTAAASEDVGPHRAEDAPPTPTPKRRRTSGRAASSSLILPALLGTFFLALYLLSGSSDLQHNGDTYLRYQTTQAMVDHHRLWLAHPAWHDTRVARGVGGHLYAFYAPGQAVLMIPLYVAGKFVAHHFSLPYDITTLYACRSLDLILGAMIAVLFFLMATSLCYSHRVSALLTLMFGAATVAWPDAQSGLEQTQVDLFVLAAVWMVWQFVRGEMARRRWLILAGSFAGLALCTRYDSLLYLPLICLYPLTVRFVRTESGLVSYVTDAAAFAAGAAPWVAAIAWWNDVRFGSPFLTGLHESTFGGAVWSGIFNLTVSPGKGLLWYMPILFLLPFALPSFYRRHPGLCVFFGALVAVPLVFYANVLYWHGDPAWGPRYLYAAVPYLVLPLGELLASWHGRPAMVRLIILGLVSVSFALQVAAVSVTEWRFWYRLEVMQQRGANLNEWRGQPFQWGAQHYHYYWNVHESPILIQLDNAYQIARLYLGDDRYRYTFAPDPWVSNPVDNYPVNSLAFWWADTRHPLFGQRTRSALALGFIVLALSSLALLLYQLRHSAAAKGMSRSGDLDLAPVRAVRS